MSDYRTLFERAGARFDPPALPLEGVLRRSNRKRRSQRLSAAAVAVIVAAAGFAILAHALRSPQRPADQPTGIFSKVSGRIVYAGDSDGHVTRADSTTFAGVEYHELWALDPSGNGPPIHLSVPSEEVVGAPVAWSRDGSELLMAVPNAREGFDLYVLNADGSEVRVAEGAAFQAGGSFSPDGSQVVFASQGGTRSSDSAVYTVSAEGGTPQLLRSPDRRYTHLSGPVFSPDGSQIAYVDGSVDIRNTIRVMDADGSHDRLLVSERSMPGGRIGCSWPGHLQWSPNGAHLAFTCHGGIWLVGMGGSIPTEWIRNASFPMWSPDGTQIAFQRPAYLAGGDANVWIADLDGTHLRLLGPGETGAWNPLPLQGPATSSAARQGSDLAASSTGMIAVLACVLAAVSVGAFAVVRRSRKKVSG